MTTLITQDGQRLTTRGPYQLTTTGRPSLAQSSLPFAAYRSPGVVSLLGGGRTLSYAQLYRRQPWVATAVNKLSRQIARLPLKVYQRDHNGDRQRVEGHALSDLLRRPWPRAGAVHLKHHIAFSLALNGNALLAEYRPELGGPPRELIPLDWRYVTGHQEFGGPVEFWETNQTGEPRYLAPEDVIHFAWGGPDGEIGVSPLEQLGITIQSEDAAQRYSQAAFKNGARLGGVLTGPEGRKIDPDDRRELREEINQEHGGVDNAFRMGILSGGWDLKPFPYQSAHEAELIEQRKVSREEIAAVYDIPPPLIGILDHATYSNVQEMHRMLYETVLGPPLTLIEETTGAQLIADEPAFRDVFCEFDLAEVLKGDRTKETGALKLAVHAGLMTINEARRVLNLPKIDHPMADQPLIPANNLSPLGAVADGKPPSEEDVRRAIAAGLNGEADSDRVETALAALRS